MDQMQLETLETSERDFKDVLEDIEKEVMKPDLTIGSIRYFIIEKTPYSFHFYAAEQLETKVNLYEMLYDLRHREYYLHKNGKEVKFTVNNLNKIIPRPSWTRYSVLTEMRQPEAVENFLNLVSVDENKGMYKKMMDMIGAQGEEKIDMPSRALIRLIEKYHRLEILYKSGIPFGCLPDHVLLYAAARNEETKPHKILGIPKQALKLVKDLYETRGIFVEYIAPDRERLQAINYLTQQQIDTYRSYINFIIELEEEYDTGSDPLREFLINNTLYNFSREANKAEVEALLGTWGAWYDIVWFIYHYDVKDAKRLIKYIYFDCLTQQGLDSDSALRLYKDYYRMNVLMENPNFEKYPRYLKTFHDITSRNFKFVEDEVAKKQFEERVNEMKMYEWVDKDFRIVAPKSTKEIVEEGQQLHHCVASYAKSVCEGRTQIVFLRAVEDPTVPLVTVEIKDGVIRQAYGLSNRVVDHDEHAALKKFAKKRNLTCKYSTPR